MKTSRVNLPVAAAGLLVVLAVSANAASGPVPEKGSAKGGAMLLIKPPGPVASASDQRPMHQRMSCAKCRNTTIQLKGNLPTQGAAGRALVAGGPASTLVARHACEGCGVEWKTTGHGKAGTHVAIHVCSACGSKSAGRCGK